MAHPLYALKCRHCGQNLQRMMLLAVLQDAGAEAGLDADLCPERQDGGQHDFADEPSLSDNSTSEGDEG